MKALLFATIALAFARVSGASQTSIQPGAGTAFPEVTVCLESHQGQTRFTTADRVIVDLVFSSTKPGFVVNTDANPFQSFRDAVDLAPDGGWVRSHAALFGQGVNGNALVSLDSGPVRVPILLNRIVTFQKPGHYEITVTTERVSFADSLAMPPMQDCGHCRKSNALGIDIAEYDVSQEPALLASLTRQLEQTTPHGLPELIPADQKEEFLRQSQELGANAKPSEDDEKKLQAWLQKMGEVVRQGEQRNQKREEARREAAERLAYLTGDNAVRTKIQFIAAAPDNGEPDPVGAIMVNGLPASSNKELQSKLLQQAWRDPHHVPTSCLQSAVRQARELVQRGWVTDDQVQFAGTDEERQAAVDLQKSDLKEILATLPLRSPENRAATLAFLKRNGVSAASDQ